MNLLQRALRLWHTVRYLKPIQFWGRLRLKLYRSRPDLSAAPSIRPWVGAWSGCARQASMTGSSTFRFLHVERSLESAVDWNNPDWPALWVYNLHYFDDLAADDAGERGAWHTALIQRWIAENPPAQGRGWDAYPISLRVVNWIKWQLAGGQLSDDALHSLAVQVRWLRKHLEIHLLGNHLWANIKALIFAGVFFEGTEADKWLSHGLRLFRRELAEQVLPDGGHFERSPMYHSILLEDLLDLVQLSAMFPAVLPEQDIACWNKTVLRMLRWLRIMTHPGGGIAFFNDATFGVAPDYAALCAYARELGATADGAPLDAIEPLVDTGYVRMEQAGVVLIADVGEVGPDYIPGHAHADTLSFELSVGRQRVLVNQGISLYEAGDERLSQRRTRAHNCVEVNGCDSSEVWSSFRVARRARSSAVDWWQDDTGVHLQGAHDGYERLAGVGQVTRCWHLSARGLVIEDAVAGECDRVAARYRAHPAFRFELTGSDGQSGTLVGANVALSWCTLSPSRMAVSDTCWHPGFYIEKSAQLLEQTGGLGLQFEWNNTMGREVDGGNR